MDVDDKILKINRKFINIVNRLLRNENIKNKLNILFRYNEYNNNEFI